MKTRPGNERGKDKSLQFANMCITYINQSQEHQWLNPDVVVCLACHILVRSVAAQPAQKNIKVTLSYLDSRLLMDAKQGNIGNTNESPFLIGPEHDDGSALWSLGRNIKVGEANATQVGSKTD